MAWEIETLYELTDEQIFSEIQIIGWEKVLWKKVNEGEPGYDQYQDNISSFTVPAEATSFQEVQFDASVDPIPTWEGIKSRFFLYAEEKHKEEYTEMEVPNVLRSLTSPTADYIEKGKDWRTFIVTTGEEKPTWAQMKAEWDLIKSQRNKKAQIAAAYKVMSDNIAAEVYNVFETSNEASANAFSQSWRIKSERPADYVGQGLIATQALGGFNPGDALDTEQKIKDYYDAKVEQLIAFDKFRDAEILTYLAAKAAIENS